VARSNNATEGNYLSNGAAAITAAPCTLAAWFNPVNVTEDHILISCSQIGAASNWFFLAANGSTAGDPVAASTNSSGSEALALSSTSFVANSWQHGCAVFTSATSRTAYLNGGGAGNDTTNLTPSGINRTYVGRLTGPDGSLYGSMNGAVAEAAIWSAALTAAEVLQLSKGLSPLLIRPASLVCYWPIYGRQSPEPDWADGLPLTINGTMAQAAHTRIFLPRAASIGRSSAASGAITGAIALSLAPAGVLTGSGALAGTVTLSITPAGALTGSGALAGSISTSLAVTGSLTGVGALSSTIPLTLTESGVLTGTGALASAMALTITPSGALTGAGALAGSLALALDLTGTLGNAAPGDINGSIPLALLTSGVLTGTGNPLGSISFSFDLTGALGGTALFTGLADLTLDMTGALTDANAAPAPVTETFTGGFLYAYELERARRRKRKREQEEREEEARALKDKVDAEIALLLAQQEAESERKAELDRLQKLVKQHSNDQLQLSDRAKIAYVRALTQANFSAMEALDRELQRQLDEEEITALMILLNED
jgi:hypothetical protein